MVRPSLRIVFRNFVKPSYVHVVLLVRQLHRAGDRVHLQSLDVQLIGRTVMIKTDLRWARIAW